MLCEIRSEKAHKASQYGKFSFAIMDGSHEGFIKGFTALVERMIDNDGFNAIRT